MEKGRIKSEEVCRNQPFIDLCLERLSAETAKQFGSKGGGVYGVIKSDIPSIDLDTVACGNVQCIRMGHNGAKRHRFGGISAGNSCQLEG